MSSKRELSNLQTADRTQYPHLGHIIEALQLGYIMKHIRPGRVTPKITQKALLQAIQTPQAPMNRNTFNEIMKEVNTPRDAALFIGKLALILKVEEPRITAFMAQRIGAAVPNRRLSPPGASADFLLRYHPALPHTPAEAWQWVEAIKERTNCHRIPLQILK